MATSKGVIQGYTGVAAVDARHQIIVDAQAHGTGSEQELLVPVVKAIKDALNDEQALITPTSLITADAGLPLRSQPQATRRSGSRRPDCRQRHEATG